MVQDEKIQVAVIIIVEEYRLGGIATLIDPIIGRHFFEGAVLLVDEQQIAPAVHVPRPRTTNIYVQPAISIDIGHRHARLPARSTYFRGLADVLEHKISLIEIYFRLV